MSKTEVHTCWMGPTWPPMEVTATYDSSGVVTGVAVDRFPECVLIANDTLVYADRRFLRRDIDGFALYADNGTARYRFAGVEPWTAGYVYRAVKVV